MTTDQPGIGQWPHGDGHPRPRPAVTPTPPPLRRALPASSSVAVALCMNSPIAWSMTPRQIDVFLTLARLQVGHAGAHSLLPNVMDALLELARRPWWDAGVAGIPHEALP